MDRLPRLDGLVVVGHVRHRAARAQVRQDHRDIVLAPGRREDVGGFGHEMHAAEHDVLRPGLADLLGGELGELEAVAGEVGEADDLVLLIVMAEDDEVRAQLGLARGDGLAELLVAHAVVLLGDRRLPKLHG